MKKLLFIAFAAALTMVSCQRNEPVSTTAQPGEVKFTTNIQTYTVKATDVSFENGDEVGVFAGSPINKANVKALVSGTSLIPVTPIKWVEGSNEVVNFYAYYPYQEGAGKIFDFYVKADQTGKGYTQSDLMLAATMSAPKETAVALNFAHALSKVVIKIDNQVPETSVKAVAFEGAALAIGVNVETGALTPVDAVPGNVKAAKDGNDYKLIIVPQTSAPKVRVSLSNGKDYIYSLASEFQFKAGKKATASLVVSPEAEAGQVEFSFSVSDWAVDEDPLVFGDPEIEDAPVDPENSWIVIGKLNGNTWDNPAVINMIEDEYHNWSADITYAAGDEFKLKCGDTWVGMKPDWGDTYGLGDFGDNSNYLSDDPSAKNIVLAAAGEYHLFFAPDTKWFVVTANGGGEDPQPEETATLTLNVLNTVGWETMNVYCWKDTTPWPCYTAAWPGDAAAAEDVVVSEVTYKSFTIAGIPQNADDIKFILNNGTDQTANLDLPALTSAAVTLFVELKSDLSIAFLD